MDISKSEKYRQDKLGRFLYEPQTKPEIITLEKSCKNCGANEYKEGFNNNLKCTYCGTVIQKPLTEIIKEKINNLSFVSTISH